jgi:hypothetical protein
MLCPAHPPSIGRAPAARHAPLGNGRSLPGTEPSSRRRCTVTASLHLVPDRSHHRAYRRPGIRAVEATPCDIPATRLRHPCPGASEQDAGSVVITSTHLRNNSRRTRGQGTAVCPGSLARAGRSPAGRASSSRPTWSSPPSAIVAGRGSAGGSVVGPKCIWHRLLNRRRLQCARHAERSRLSTQVPGRTGS